MKKSFDAFGTKQNSWLECLLVLSVAAVKVNLVIQRPVCKSTE